MANLGNFRATAKPSIKRCSPAVRISEPIEINEPHENPQCEWLCKFDLYLDPEELES